MVVLVLALLLALAMLVAVVVAPLLADARGRNPPRLVTRAGKNSAPKVVSAVVAFVLLLGFFIAKIINKLCLPITTPLPVCSVMQPSGVKTCLPNVCNAVVS